MVVVEHFKNAKDVKEYVAGTVIFREGDPGDFMYGVQDGEVELIHGEQSLAIVGPGSIFGEMALIDNAPRTATAIAVTDCKLVPVDKHYFQFLVHETPTFAARVMQTLSKRLREAEGLDDLLKE